MFYLKWKQGHFHYVLVEISNTADFILCVGYSATYQLQDKMISRVMNRQRVFSVEKCAQ